MTHIFSRALPPPCFRGGRWDHDSSYGDTRVIKTLLYGDMTASVAKSGPSSNRGGAPLTSASVFLPSYFLPVLYALLETIAPLSAASPRTDSQGFLSVSLLIPPPFVVLNDGLDQSRKKCVCNSCSTTEYIIIYYYYV